MLKVGCLRTVVMTYLLNREALVVPMSSNKNSPKNEIPCRLCYVLKLNGYIKVSRPPHMKKVLDEPL